MKNNAGYSLLALLVVFLVSASPYIYNGYKLSNCDFQSDYKCEAIHGIGVIIPPASLITLWFDDDKE